VSSDGKVLSLSKPIQFDHLGARDGNGVPNFLPDVGDLSRNIKVHSQNASGTRGYALFTERAEVDIRYAQFSGLGGTKEVVYDNTTFDSGGNVSHLGTNEQGRYAIYMDHLILGNAVFCPLRPMPYGWGIALNDTDYGLVQDNVLYNWAGAGIVAESGSESYNLIQHNFVVSTQFLNPIRVPLFKGADKTITGQFQWVNMEATPLLQFSGNEAYGAVPAGMTIWHLATDGETNYDQVGTSVIQGFKVWHVHQDGFFGYETNRLTIDGFVGRNNPSVLNSLLGAYGIGFADYYTRNLDVKNADIQGFGIGFSPSHNTGNGTQRIENSYLRDQYDVYVAFMWTSRYRSDEILPRVTYIQNVVFATPNIPMNGDHYDLNMEGYPWSDVMTMIQKDQVFVYNYNGVAGDNFQLFYLEQSPGFVLPQSTFNSDGTHRLFASPVSGINRTGRPTG
jgi:hypothetical protein